jgi:hypothetical protein
MSSEISSNNKPLYINKQGRSSENAFRPLEHISDSNSIKKDDPNNINSDQNQNSNNELLATATVEAYHFDSLQFAYKFVINE